MSVAPNKALYTILLLVFIAVPVANFLPFIGGGERGEARFDDDPEVYVAAADYAFSIWSVIFLGMLAFSWGIFSGKETAPTPALHRAIKALIVAGLASIAFVPISFTNNQTCGWLDILVHLIALIAAVKALRQHVAEQPTDSGWRWTYFAPSIYLGWISAAYVISTSLMVIELGADDIPERIQQTGAMFLVAVLFFIARWLISKADAFYGLTVIWALIAIGVKQPYPPGIRWIAWGAAATLGILILARILGKEKLFYAR
ncbi:MAG: hypothetical protein AAF433_13935 [Bacteroidota bacterium]